jgi:hypothetical protein
MKKLNIALMAALITLATGCSKTTGVGGASGDATRLCTR